MNSPFLNIMVKEDKFYKILGINSDASPQQIKQAYRKLAVQYHPDRHHSLNASEKAEMSEKFKNIARAYEVLSDEKLREMYDRFGEKGLDENSAPDFSGEGFFSGGGFGFPGGFPFSGGFQNMKSKPRQPPPIRIDLNISLKDVYLGSETKIKFERQHYCDGCDGKGGLDIENCSNCNGRGVVLNTVKIGPGMIQQSQSPCPKCKETGVKILKPCKTCHGEKLATQSICEQICIPKGVKDEDNILLKGKGHHLNKKSEKGDVVVFLHVEQDQIFTRVGKNLLYEAKICLTDALCGGTIVIDHLDKHQIVVKLDFVIQPGKLYCIHGEGMPVKNSVEKGDLIIKPTIEFPSVISDTNRQILIQALGKSQKNEKTKIRENHYETGLHVFNGQIESDNESQENEGDANRPPNGVQCQPS